jgi:hypothetical protein
VALVELLVVVVVVAAVERQADAGAEREVDALYDAAVLDVETRASNERNLSEVVTLAIIVQ